MKKYCKRCLPMQTLPSSLLPSTRLATMEASSCSQHVHERFLLPLFRSIDSAARLSSLLLLLHFGLFCSPHHVDAAFPGNPSTDSLWTLSDYYNTSLELLPIFSYRNFAACNKDTLYLDLLNGDEGLYGRPTPIRSVHNWARLSVSFALYFVIAAESVCMIKRNSSDGVVPPLYYLSLVAINDVTMSGTTQNTNNGQVMWTANTEKPVSNNACLELGEDSNLKLVEYYPNQNRSEIVWQSNTTNKTINATLAFTFEGNLVLFSNTTDPPYVPLWESHRSPTNTLMVLQVLHQNSTLSFRHNLSSSETVSRKHYTMRIENGSIILYARFGQRLQGESASPYGSRYWVSSVASNMSSVSSALCWDPVQGLRLSALSNDSRSAEISPAACSDTTDAILQLPDPDPRSNITYATFIRLDADGDLRAYTVSNVDFYYSKATWRPFYSVFNSSPCDLPLHCGFYGVCHQQQLTNGSHCACDDQEFEFIDKFDPRAGCKLKTNQNSDRELWNPTKWENGSLTDPDGPRCANAKNDSVCAANSSHCSIEFLRIQNLHYFSLSFIEPQHVDNTTQPDPESACKEICLGDCTCTVAFWNPETSSCFLIRGPVGTIKQGGNMVAFFKYINIKHPPNIFRWIMVGSVLAVTLLMATVVFLVYLFRRRRALAYRMRELEKERLLLLPLLDGNTTDRFSWKQMQEYTCGFSDLLGSGGFGRVFRGSLPDGTAIAVKQLDEDRSQGQGNKEFITEVSILSRIHHAHLVRLIGFCLEGSHRLLVYEYMENGSLDAWILEAPPLPLHVEKSNKRKGLLTWRIRFQIAVGTSKGLAYLHEECEERVIHMDFKPQNILLGHNFTPKISDFGMSSRTAREQTTVMTVMRGTPGYLAPEWLLDCAVTEKCDVYGFGIVLLEMVSGRKVKDLKAVKQKLSMRPLRESVMLEFLDEKLKYNDSNVNEEEVVRTVEVALLCVRKDPSKRPAMSRVALMLEGREEVQLGHAADEDDDGYGDDAEELVVYPSTINKTMRIRRPDFHFDDVTSSFPDDSGSNVWSSGGSASSIRNKYDRSFHVVDSGDTEKAATQTSLGTNATNADSSEEQVLLMNQ